MNIQLVNVGFGNIVSTQRIVAIVSPDSAPEARDRGQLIDGTYGRRTRAVLIMDSGHVILSAIQPETIASRAQGEKS
jgi:extracellular matrix regulatory protein A